MPNKSTYFIKSIIDLFLGIIVLLIAFPFMIVIALILIIIFRTLPFIIQKRGITEENQVFNIYKFKTIKPNSENNIRRDRNILYKSQLLDYIPAFCRWLRKSGLDELPQLINVIKREMSLIGPRPLMVSDLNILRDKYPEYYRKRQAITVKPGITGLWQVYGDRRRGIENLINFDIEYNEKVSVSLDIEIFLATLPLLFRGKHSDAIIYGMKESRLANSTTSIRIDNTFVV